MENKFEVGKLYYSESKCNEKVLLEYKGYDLSRECYVFIMKAVLKNDLNYDIEKIENEVTLSKDTIKQEELFFRLANETEKILYEHR